MSTEADSRDEGSVSWPRVIAPGKIFLAGEYGVLQGATALVMAINRHVRMSNEEPASIDGGISTPVGVRHTEQVDDPLLRVLIEEARSIATLPGTPFHLDAQELYSPNGQKLGLGSSAAKAAAVITGAFLLAGEAPDLPSTRQRILKVAMGAHNRSGGGSGADVAAAVLGGAVEYRLLEKDVGIDGLCSSVRPYLARKADLPSRSMPLVVHGNSPVSTRDAISRLDAAREAGNSSIERHLDMTAEAGEQLARCLMDPAASDRELLELVDQSSNTLLELTQALGLGAGSGASTLDTATSVARRLGGAAKPSGAGGGDLVLVFVPAIPLEERRQAASALDRAGLHVLDVAIDENGVREERAGLNPIS